MIEVEGLSRRVAELEGERDAALSEVERLKGAAGDAMEALIESLSALPSDEAMQMASETYSELQTTIDEGGA